MFFAFYNSKGGITTEGHSPLLKLNLSKASGLSNKQLVSKRSVLFRAIVTISGLIIIIIFTIMSVNCCKDERVLCFRGQKI